MRLLINAVVTLLFASGSAFANGPPPMAAVGSLERAGRIDCSAVLVAPDLLATAAHCVAGQTLVAEGGTFTIVFRTGQYHGHPSVARNAVRLMPHPLYLTAKVGNTKPMGVDMALIALDEPVPPDVARPIPLGPALTDEDRVLVAGYPGGLGARARERMCPILSFKATIARLSCKVVPGESGSPVMRKTENGVELAAIIVASSTETQPPYGLVVQAEVRIRQVMAVYGIVLP